jgi:hypothetical protein
MKRRWPEARTLAIVGLLLGLLTFCAVRLGQAVAGGIPPLRAAGEVALLLGLVGLGALAPRLVGSGSTVAWVVTGLCLVAWGAGVGLPLWRLAHPPRALFEGRLDGANREVASAPAGRAGRHQVRVAMVERDHRAAARDEVYVLHVLGRDKVTLVGKREGRPEEAEVVLEQARPATIHLDWSLATLEVRLRPAPPPRGVVVGGGLLALALAILADAVGMRAWPRGRGLVVALVAASVLFVLSLEQDGMAARAVMGAAGLAVVGGGIAGGVMSAVTGAAARAFRRRGATRGTPGTP